MTLTEKEQKLLNMKYPDGVLFSTCPEADWLQAGQTPTCPFCGEPTPFMGILIADSVHWLRAQTRACTCPEAEKSREAAEKALVEEEQRKKQEEHMTKVENLRKRSGLEARELICTFDHFVETQANSKALKTARRYAERVIDGTTKKLPQNSLYIFGSYGTGKTYLAAAISNAVLEGGKRVVYTRFGELCRDVQRAFDKGSKESEEAILHKYKACPLLVLDDLGKEKYTDWSLALLFELIDARYRRMLPTVITANYSLAETVKKMTINGTDKAAAGAIADRITGAYFMVQLGGSSWRTSGSN